MRERRRGALVESCKAMLEWDKQRTGLDGEGRRVRELVQRVEQDVRAECLWERSSARERAREQRRLFAGQ